MKKISKILIGLGILFIVISLVMCIYHIYLENLSEKKTHEILQELETKIEINTNELNDNQEVVIDGYEYFGTLYLPSINIKLPISNKFDYNRLVISPCIYYGSIENNNLVICGHSYREHFKYLNNLEIGDIIVIKDINGINYLYKVEALEVLAKTEVKEMLESEFDLILFTCTNSGIDRLAIRCSRIYE